LKNIGMVSLGCPKNQVDAEIMLSILKAGGYNIVADEKMADIIIVNTCGFIEDAKKEAIENILEIAELKKSGSLKLLVMTGCMAERYKNEVKTQLPEVDIVVGIGSNKDIVNIIENKIESSFADKNELLLSHDRVLSTPFYTAYLKIADGCDNKCSYCAIPLIRGRFRSRTVEDVLDEAEKLVAGGVKELILVAQDTTRFGVDLYGKPMLTELLKKLSKIEKLRWIRILYAYPDMIDDELINEIADNEKIVKYLDIPLQHCDGDVLRAMNRSGNRKSLTALLLKLRQRVKGITLRTTFIAGFPGETEEQFTSLCEFVKEVKFDRMGAFAYSPEEDTPAAEFDNQIPDDIKARRLEILMDEQYFIGDELSQSKIGADIDVLVEGYDDYIKKFYGRGPCDAPDIDQKIFFEGNANIGDIVTVHISDRIEHDLLGVMV